MCVNDGPICSTCTVPEVDGNSVVGEWPEIARKFTNLLL